MNKRGKIEIWEGKQQMRRKSENNDGREHKQKDGNKKGSKQRRTE